MKTFLHNFWFIARIFIGIILFAVLFVGGIYLLERIPPIFVGVSLSVLWGIFCISATVALALGKE